MKSLIVKNRISILLFLVLSGLTFHACNDDIDPRSKLGFEEEFYPLDLGRYWEYRIDSVTYAIDGSMIDSTISYIREEVVDSYVDAASDTIAVIDKLWKRNLTDKWKIQKAITATISNYEAIRTEDNRRLIKLVLPPSIGATWDSNAFIDPFQDVRVAGGELVKVYKDWTDAQVFEREAIATIGGSSYNNLVTVILTDSESTIEKRYAKEQYAKGVGMVAAEYIILDTQCNGCDGLEWTEKAEQGFVLKQVLMDHN